MSLLTFTNKRSFFNFYPASLSRLIACFFYLISLALGSHCLANYAYVANTTTNNLSVIDTETNTVIANIDLPHEDNWHYLAVSPDGSHVYVTNYSNNTVTVIDTSTNTIERTINGLNQPLGIAIAPDGNHAYIANSGSGTVSILNINTHTITDTFAIGALPVGIAITPDGHYAYLTSLFDNAVSVIDITNNTVMTPISVSLISPGATFGIAISPDGAHVYVTNYEEAVVSIIQTSDNTLVRKIDVAPNPLYLSITADGQYVYVSSENHTVSVINTANNTLETTIPIPEGIFVGSATLSSRAVYVTDSLNNLVYVIDTETQTVTHSIPVGASPNAIVITPDIAPLPPTSLACLEKKNQFLNQADVINVITWAPASSGTAATRYIIYRDSLLNPIGEVAANEPLIFYDHNRRPTTPALYYVKAVSEAGAKSSEAVVAIYGALLPPG